MDYKEKIQQLAAILDQIIEALEVAEDIQYLQIFKRYRGGCEYVTNKEEANELARNILHSYRGGMGSFSDFSLYTNGEYIPGPATEFDRLKTQLPELCIDIITRPRES
jgi:hypothetical protein